MARIGESSDLLKCSFCGKVKRCCVMNLNGGFLPDVVEHFFAISAERRVQHPLVQKVLGG